MSELRTLLPPNARPLIRAAERVMAEHKAGLAAPISTLWNADTCPVDLLPWLAWGFSVEVWKSGWTEAVKRAVVRDAIRVHRLKGTRQSVETALSALGFRIDLVEAWQEGGTPHTFRLDAYADEVIGSGFGLDPALVQTINRLIETVKPVRSQFTMRIGQSFRFAVLARSGTRARQVVLAELAPAVPVRHSGSSLAMRNGITAQARLAGAVRPVSSARSTASTTLSRVAIHARQIIRATLTMPVTQEAPYAA